MNNTHFASRLERLLASGACETFLMVRIAHGGDHFALHIQFACSTFRAKELLIVDGAVVRIVLGEKAPGRQ